MAGKWNITETSQGKATELPVVQFIKDSNYFQPHLHIEHYFVLPPSQDNLLQSHRDIGSSTQGTPNSRISDNSIVSSARETLNPVDAYQHILKSPLTSSKRPSSNSTMGVVLSSKRPRNVTAITSPYGFRRTR
ncbi:hypothetical protein B0O99DRAFT_682995 [Bisporella sp. PMI_857]|nr:hypothetical protein B0O99DRAFT_682995 [Bisporella sp. PMI_857]